VKGAEQDEASSKTQRKTEGIEFEHDSEPEPEIAHFRGGMRVVSLEQPSQIATLNRHRCPARSPIPDTVRDSLSSRATKCD
jgi:hypothetical protein